MLSQKSQTKKTTNHITPICMTVSKKELKSDQCCQGLGANKVDLLKKQKQNHQTPVFQRMNIYHMNIR